MKTLRTALAAVSMLIAPWALSEPATDLLLEEAVTLQNAGQSALALPALIKAYKISPDSYQVNLLLGWNFLQTAQLENAAFHYAEAQRLKPQAIDARLGLIRTRIQQSLWSEALPLATQLVATAPDHLYANFYLFSTRKFLIFAKPGINYLKFT